MTSMTSLRAAALPTRAHKSLLSRLVTLNAVYRQRRALAALDAAALADLGLSRSEAETEAARPFWDAPAHWCK
jgi:uncharacterized protein YjiS (DUF1127 family)